MSDYITKNQAIKAVEGAVSAEHVCDNINAIPAADVEPVVRCKDCKWYKTGVCDFLGTVTLDDDYCSIGARAERSGSGEK